MKAEFGGYDKMNKRVKISSLEEAMVRSLGGVDSGSTRMEEEEEEERIGTQLTTRVDGTTALGLTSEEDARFLNSKELVLDLPKNVTTQVHNSSNENALYRKYGLVNYSWALYEPPIVYIHNRNELFLGSKVLDYYDAYEKRPKGEKPVLVYPQTKPNFPVNVAELCRPKIDPFPNSFLFPKSYSTVDATKNSSFMVWNILTTIMFQYAATNNVTSLNNLIIDLVKKCDNGKPDGIRGNITVEDRKDYALVTLLYYNLQARENLKSLIEPIVEDQDTKRGVTDLEADLAALTEKAEIQLQLSIDDYNKTLMEMKKSGVKDGVVRMERLQGLMTENKDLRLELKESRQAALQYYRELKTLKKKLERATGGTAGGTTAAAGFTSTSDPMYRVRVGLALRQKLLTQNNIKFSMLVAGALCLRNEQSLQAFNYYDIIMDKVTKKEAGMLVDEPEVVVALGIQQFKPYFDLDTEDPEKGGEVLLSASLVMARKNAWYAILQMLKNRTGMSMGFLYKDSELLDGFAALTGAILTVEQEAQKVKSSTKTDRITSSTAVVLSRLRMRGDLIRKGYEVSDEFYGLGE